MNINMFMKILLLFFTMLCGSLKADQNVFLPLSEVTYKMGIKGENECDLEIKYDGKDIVGLSITINGQVMKIPLKYLFKAQIYDYTKPYVFKSKDKYIIDVYINKNPTNDKVRYIFESGKYVKRVSVNYINGSPVYKTLEAK